MSRKQVLAGCVVAAAVIATGGTVAAASTFKTTEQKAAEAGAPTPTVTTVPVEVKQLFDTVPLSCDVAYRTQLDIRSSSTGPAVVTAMPLTDGSVVDNGTLLGEINGSPIFALTGSFPLYRDLAVGDTGPDARLVNNALMALGLLNKESEPALSTISAATRDAIAHLYNSTSYSAPPESGPVVALDAFHIISGPGTVSGPPHGPGTLGQVPLLSLGLGERGLFCSSPAGGVPPEAKNGQQATVPGLADKQFGVAIVTAPAATLPAAANGQNVSPAGTGQAQGSAAQPGTGGTTQFVFISVGAAANGLKGTVPASLVVGGSAPKQLVVPSAALWTKDSKTVVSIVNGDTTRDVPVTVGFSAGGENAVTADPESALTAGDQVAVATR